MSFDPCVLPARLSADQVPQLGHPVLDRYLLFVASRCRPNTVLASACDLRAFFAVVAPPFMFQDPIGRLFYPLLPDAFPEHQLLALDVTGAVVARINSVPFVWTGTDEDLPARGWDAVLERAFADRDRGVRPNAVSLLEARVAPAQQRAGASSVLLQAARTNVRQQGLRDLFGPVRPTAKSHETGMAMERYAAQFRPDGLPADPWLRVHARLGGRLVKVCPLSMTISGTVADWREWTGLPLLTSGLVDVPGALSPIHVSVEHDHAVYVEANVWVHHQLAER